MPERTLCWCILYSSNLDPVRVPSFMEYIYRAVFQCLVWLERYDDMLNFGRVPEEVATLKI